MELNYHGGRGGMVGRFLGLPFRIVVVGTDPMEVMVCNRMFTVHHPVDRQEAAGLAGRGLEKLLGYVTSRVHP